MNPKNKSKFFNLKRPSLAALMLVLVIGLTPVVSHSTFGQEDSPENTLSEFNYQKINTHILSLRRLRNEKNEALGAEALLDKLRAVENYGQSLAHYLLDAFSKDELQPYTLNLMHEYFLTQISVHERVHLLKKGEIQNEILMALQIESFKKIHDLFFHKKSLRTLIKDQFELPAIGLQSWHTLREKTLNKSFIKNRERFLKTNAFPLKKDQVQNQIVLSAWVNSGLYRALEKNQSWERLSDRELFWRSFGDGVLAGLGKVTTGASAAFGAVAGSIAWREGYLKNNRELLNNLEEGLKPFDLLMEKKAYKFTDITIPGHWGHVGVYMGSEEQLRELGLWDLEEMAPFRPHISKGKRIFQVRRWGLVFDSLEDFSNLDEMAVLRVEDFTKKGIQDLTMTLKYLGDQVQKEYDFSFDAMTGETITCTEIIAFSYGPIKWPMDKILGRLTISPNNLAELSFFTGAPLKVVSYITGDENGMLFHSEQDFGRTLDYYKRGDVYKKHSLDCDREMIRSRRNGTRFKYSCDDILTERIY